MKAILESLLFAAGEPVSLAKLAAVLESVPRDSLKRALNAMTLAYADGFRGIVLEQVAGGYQLRTPKEHAFYVRKLLASRPPRLTRPLMETLAIIAYRQPITRPEIEQLRGVDCAGVLETLMQRRFVRIEGRKDAPGRPLLYGTTPEFLETFGLADLESLPDISELREVEEAIEAAGEADKQVQAGNEQQAELPLEQATAAAEPAAAAGDAGEGETPSDATESDPERS